MTFYYLDPGLSSNLGHHATAFRSIVGELRKREMPVKAYCHQSMSAELSFELQVEPYLRWNTYQHTDGDPISGWLGGFMAGARSIRKDMGMLGFSNDDILYINSVQAAEFLGVVQWMTSGAYTVEFPHVILEFGVSPGLDVLPDGNLGARDPRFDAQAILLRYAATQMRPEILPYLSLVTYDKTCSEAFSKLLGKPVHTLPVPRSNVKDMPSGNPTFIRGCRGTVPFTVGFIGHLRRETGFHLLPDIIRRLLAESKVNVLVHAGDPSYGGPHWQELKIISETAAGRLRLTSGAADAATWGDLLDRIDLMVLPYDPNRFRFSYSSVACEAIANGIPLVVPKGTTMERLAVDFEAGHGCSAKWDAREISDAALYMASRWSLQAYADYSFAAAKKWAETQGPAKTVDAMLQLAGVGEPDKMLSFG